MKKIYKLALTELQTLFYSPVAWLILVIFLFQVGMTYCSILEPKVLGQELGHTQANLTMTIFSGWRGLFEAIQRNLYFYVPLLTMGLMSREFGSGSIKLLYSSPITNTQIILGKFLAMMVYGGCMLGGIFVVVLHGACTVQNFDMPVVLTGMLGLYLLFCTYASIGLFMSSLTSYQVVAAIGTIAIFAMLGYVGNSWQHVEFVRDLTYWLAINGRASQFVNGMICSEDIAYFVLVSALFLSLSVLRLNAVRQKSTFAMNLGRYVGVCVVALLLGYLTTLPVLKLYYDATRMKVNTLTQNSQDIVKMAEGGMTITTFSNLMAPSRNIFASPENINRDKERLSKFIRFKPEIKLRYVYYYDTTTNVVLDRHFPNLTLREKMAEVAEVWKLDTAKVRPYEEVVAQYPELAGEAKNFVRLIERESGEKTFLRIYDDMMVHPDEKEIAAAIKRIVMRLPKVGFVTGHGERDINKGGDRDYLRFSYDKPARYALINQGFDVCEVRLRQDIPEDINILVIADVKTAYSPEEYAVLSRYIDRGGNLLIAGEPRRIEAMNPIVEPLGVRFLPGGLVRPTEDYPADLILGKATPATVTDIAYAFTSMVRYGTVATMPSCCPMEYSEDKGFRVIPMLMSDTIGVWNELETTDFLDDTVRLNSAIGEIEKAWPLGLALQRQVGDKVQKIVVLGDADCLSNGEGSRTRREIAATNYLLMSGSFYWLSDGEVPVDTRRDAAPDRKIEIGKAGMRVTTWFFWWVLPGLLLITGIIVWIRRRGR